MLCFGVALVAKAIRNLVDVPVPTNIDGSAPDLEQVKNAILAGCRYKRWTPLVDEDGNISCSILVRAEHYAEASIPYTASSYSVLYKDSRELNYNEAR